MRQRVVIALALCAGPRLIVADEPTTALDVSIQAQIIALLKRLCREHATAVMLVTHDMGVIAETADRVAVMYAGRIAEIGPVRDVVKHAKHPYTKGLMGSIPSLGVRHDRLTQIDGAMPRLTEIPPGCAFNPRCTVRGERCLVERPDADVGRHQPRRLLAARSRRRRRAGRPRSWSMPDAPPPIGGTGQFVRIAGLKRYFDVSAPWLVRTLEGRPRQIVQAVDGIDIEIAKGETFSLVGESGCGKSTVARLVVGLYTPTAGSIEFDGNDMAARHSRSDMAALRRRMQMIFQDPFASLNPRWRVFDIIAEPIRAFGLSSGKADLEKRVGELLRQVKLTPADGRKYPHEFSGGQRQRISIARALASEPEFLVCDEPTSALDVSVQAQILNLMVDLQRRLQLTYLFISHNLAVVYHISTRVGVMYLGRLVEVAPTDTLVPPAQAPLYADAPGHDSRPRHDRPPARAGGGRGAEPDQPALGLHLPSALSFRQRALQGRAAQGVAHRRRHGRLPRDRRGSPPG